MEEQWRPVVGYEGLYEVSHLGRVRSTDRITPHGHNREGRMMTPRPISTSDPHLVVTLTRDGKALPRKIHRLVLAAFVGPCPPGHVCRHFPDRDPMNNRLDNLQWSTPAQNAADRRYHGTEATGDRNGSGKLSALDVRRIRASHAEGMSIMALTRVYGLAFRTVNNIVKRKTWADLQ